jgi:hypothetical protein
MPLQAMLPHTTSRVASVRPASSLVNYQRATAAHNFLTQRTPMPQKHQPTRQQFTPHQNITAIKNQRFNFERPPVSQKKSDGSWLTALGLGWLWYNSEDEKKDEEKSEQDANNKDITLDQFVKKYAPPKKIQETIEAHKDAVSPRTTQPYLIEGTNPPIYHKKNDIDRIINAEMLREVIKQNNLDIEIPKKYIYPNPRNGKYEVFAEWASVRPIGTEQLTLKETQALMTLTVESLYIDFNKDNLFRNTQNNKLVIIDTEDASFYRYPFHGAPEYIKTKTSYVDRAINKFNRDFKISSDAQAWASNYLEQLKNSSQEREVVDLYASRYNKLNISAEKSKELQREIQKQNQGQEAFAAKTLWFMKHAIQSRLGL